MRDGMKCLRESFINHSKADAEWKERFEPYLSAKLAEQKDDADFMRERKRAWKVKVYDSVFYAFLACAAFVLVNVQKAREFIVSALK